MTAQAAGDAQRNDNGEARGGDPEAFVERLFASALGTLDWLTIHVGERLGLYRVAQEGPLTAAELAAHAGVNERYAREWLEQQTVGGIIESTCRRLVPTSGASLCPPGTLRCY